MRRELAADLGRGGYVYHASGDQVSASADRYFEKALVLSRPGLVARSARLLVDLVSDDCERLAVTDAATATLGSAIAQETGLPLLLGTTGSDGAARFDGEAFPGVRVLVLADVVLTGQRALADVCAVRAIGGEVVDVVCLLDREGGGAQQLANAGVGLRALFREVDLLSRSTGGSG
jgi:orotate phosphoribosyltransferase